MPGAAWVFAFGGPSTTDESLKFCEITNFVMLLVGVSVRTYGNCSERGLGQRWGMVGNFVALSLYTTGPWECSEC